ncbi:MAG: BspA family leucine-rich repeat surface protein [Candidatus Nanoarchaeia archaeon]
MPNTGGGGGGGSSSHSGVEGGSGVVIIKYTLPKKHFISQWNTSLGDSSNTITLPLIESGNYSFLVDWGDGNRDFITNWNQSEISHTYSSQGVYTIQLIGDLIEGFNFNQTNGVHREKIINVEEWGNISLGNNGAYFRGAKNVNFNATDSPNLNQTTNMSKTFENATLFNSDISMWNTSSVEDMSYIFSNATNFNQSLNSWSTSSVQNMSYMFSNANSFNQPLDNWNVSSVEDMSHLFSRAKNFNQPLNSWNTISLNSMNSLFANAINFNQNLNSWNLENVTSLKRVFFNATSFNQSLNSWNTSNVENMYALFASAISFNQPLNDWDVSNVDNMSSIFSNSTLFEQSISNWNTQNVVDMSNMFSSASNFNSFITFWNVSSVTNMDSMFQDATLFNQNLSCWDVTNIGSEPDNFATNSSLIEANKPIWGTEGNIVCVPVKIEFLNPTNNSKFLYNSSIELNWNATNTDLFNFNCNIIINNELEASQPCVENTNSYTFVPANSSIQDYDWEIEVELESQLINSSQIQFQALKNNQLKLTKTVSSVTTNTYQTYVELGNLISNQTQHATIFDFFNENFNVGSQDPTPNVVESINTGFFQGELYNYNINLNALEKNKNITYLSTPDNDIAKISDQFIVGFG